VIDVADDDEAAELLAEFHQTQLDRWLAEVAEGSVVIEREST